MSQNGDDLFMFLELEIFSLKLRKKTYFFAIGKMTQYRLKNGPKFETKPCIFLP